MKAGRLTEIMRRGTKGPPLHCGTQSAIKISLQYSDHYSLTQRDGFPGTKLGIIVLASLDYLLMTFNCPIRPL